MTEQSTETRLALLEDSIPRIESNTREILIILQGSGDSSGLKGKVDVNRNSIKRIWWSVGSFGTFIISAMTFVATKLL